MKLITIEIAFLSSLYCSKLSGVGKINPVIIKPKIPTNIPGLNKLGDFTFNNDVTQIVANNAEPYNGIEGMPNSVISGGSVIGFGLGNTKTTKKGPNSVEVVGKKDLEEMLTNASKAESDGSIKSPEKETKIEAPIETEKPLPDRALNGTKDSDSLSLQNADSGEESSSRWGITSIIGGVGSAVYSVGSTAVGLVSSVVDTAVSGVIVPIVSPIVSPVVNLATGSGNDQAKAENIKPISALDALKDAGSAAVGLASSAMETAVSDVAVPIVSPVVNLVTGSGNDQAKAENIKPASVLNKIKDAGSAAVGLASSAMETAVSGVAIPIVSPIVSPVVNLVTGSENDQPKVENTKPASILNRIKDAGSAAVGLASSAMETAVSGVAIPIVSPIVSPLVNLVTGSGNDQAKVENTKSASALNGVNDASSPGLLSTDKKEATGSRWRLSSLFGSN